jgi:hypothetical protein
MVLLTTYIYYSELKALTAPPLITTALAKSFSAHYVFTGRFLVTVSNSVDFSASRAQVSSSQISVQNSLNRLNNSQLK